MTRFTVEVTIQNKPLAKDPEGETIRRNLVNRGGYEMVKEVRSGKYLRMEVEETSAEKSKQLVKRMCSELRIFNPVVHVCSIKVSGESH